MPFRQRLQNSRFEMKYLVSETCARNVRDFVGSYLELDEHADPTRPHSAYRVASLYLDTASLDLYGQTMSGVKNRFKLRIRFYDDLPESPTFLEIKGRQADVICKERVCVTRQGVRCLLQGGVPDDAHLMNQNGSVRSSVAVLRRFYQLGRSIQATETAYVSYLREAYVTPDSNQVRVTFDRQLMGTLFDAEVGLEMPRDGVKVKRDEVILELKFTDRFPNWMHDLVQTFNIQRCSVPKYCHSIEALGLHSSQRRIVARGIA